MASNLDANKSLVSMIAVLASAVLLFWGTGIHPKWWLTWVATLPVLLIAVRVSGLTAFGIATLAWFLGGLNMWRYLVSVLGPPKNAGGPRLLPMLIVIAILLVPSCFFGLSVLLWRAFIRRGSLWRAVVALPALWVTYEYINAVSSPHSTFGNLAYTQMDFLPLLQLASLTGVWGISFCLFLLPGTVATLVMASSDWKQKRTIAITAGVVFVAILGFGWWRLRSAPATTGSVVVGLVASDTPENVFPQEPEQMGRLIRDYLEQAKSLAAQGARVVVLPEKLWVVIDAKSTSDMDAMIDSVARETGAEIVAGVIRRSSTVKFNEARIYSGKELAPLFYEKEHMLPAFESSFQPGTARVSFDKESGRWGVAICKDMDFPQLSRQYGADHVGLLLVPAWDFRDDGWLHGRMAIMREVESGFSMARAPKQGLLTVSDDRGRILAERSSGAGKFATLLASVPVGNDTTLYRSLGDWFAWLNLGVLVWLLAGLVRGV